MFLTTRGLVLREVRYKEADKILTVLTQHEGKVTVRARRAAQGQPHHGGDAAADLFGHDDL